MEVKFLTDELKLLYQTGSSKKYKTVPMQVAKKLVRAVDVLSAATVIQDVWKFPSYNFEHLEGNRDILCAWIGLGVWKWKLNGPIMNAQSALLAFMI
ncbi:MAG: type II toxin-antitoxin system RelE/ParE family toxin [Treponema sp.]|nr:type II toxin-antitoxin system RelE/ParE family toxin [Treponema sp.]